MNSILSSVAGTDNQTVYVNTSINNITYTTTGATGIGTLTRLPAGVSVSFENDTITISGMPTATGTFSFSIPLIGGCGALSVTGTITVNTSTSIGIQEQTLVSTWNFYPNPSSGMFTVASETVLQ